MNGVGPQAINVQVDPRVSAAELFEVKLVGPRGGVVRYALLTRYELLRLARDCVVAAVGAK